MNMLHGLSILLVAIAAGCLGTESTNPPGGGFTCDDNLQCIEHCDQIAAARRLAPTDASMPIVSVRLAECHLESPNQCTCVGRVDDQCWVDMDPEAYDCALSNDEIIVMHRAVRP